MPSGSISKIINTHKCTHTDTLLERIVSGQMQLWSCGRCQTGQLPGAQTRGPSWPVLGAHTARRQLCF